MTEKYVASQMLYETLRQGMRTVGPVWSIK